MSQAEERYRTSGRPYAEIVGDPPDPGPSLLIHRYWLHKTGLDADCRTRLVPAGSLMEGMTTLRDHLAHARQDPFWRGCMILPPLKEAAAALADQRRTLAATLGTADLVIREQNRLVACNSAAVGFVAPLRGRIDALPARRALILGAGCHARMAAHVLSDLGLSLTVATRQVQGAARLVKELGPKKGHRATSLESLPAERAGFGLLVNATPLGGTGKPCLPPVLGLLGAGALVYELVREPFETELVATARQKGHPTISGFEMMIGQAAIAFESLFGPRAPRTLDDQLRLLLVP